MEGDHELDILFPDREVTVRDPDSGRPATLTLREFRFREGLEATAIARPLIAALAALVPGGAGENVAPEGAQERGEDVAPEGAQEDVAPEGARGNVAPEGARENVAPDALAVESALAAHAALWLELAARACDRDASWLARLGDADGRALSEAMWAANGEFFLRRVVARLAARTQGQGASQSRSTACSTPSSVPATAAATTTSASA